MLKIQLLGTPKIYWENELVHIPRRASRALLFYLAANKESVRRLHLCDFLWAEIEDEGKQRSNLRGTLNNLRNAFPDKEVIKAYHGTIGLAKEDVYVDILDFLSVVKEMRQFKSVLQATNPTVPASLYQDLIRAAELWQGETFIDNGDMYLSSKSSEWWLAKNRELKKDQLDLYKFLTYLENQYGKSEAAILWAEKALAIDDFDEKTHFILLQSLHTIGEDRRARQHYLMLEERREDDFSGHFSKEINALGEELFREKKTGPLYVRPEWPVRSSATVPFVGQEDAIQKMRQNYRIGQVSLVLGEAGAGKTRLVQEFYKSLEIEPRLLLIPCHLVDENIPYQPLADMLRRSVSKDIWLNLPAVWVEPLTMLVPELSVWRDDLHPENAGYAKTVLFEAVKNLLNLIAQDQPYLFFVDDIQWADAATITLLAYLHHEDVFAGKNMRLIISSRIEEENEEFKNLFLNSPTHPLSRINIQRLSENNIQDLAFHVLKEKLSPEASQHLLRETGGNPFFVLEILLAIWRLPNRGDLSSNLPVPASVKELLHRRIEKLSSDAREVLLIAAILGNPFEFAILERTAHLTLEELMLIMDELEDAQLISEGNEEVKLEYAFVHDKIRETLVASLAPARKRLLHKKIAQTLEELTGDYKGPQAAVLAEHYEEADESSLAFQYWVEAGKHAYQFFSISDATVAFKRAENLISQKTLTDEDIYALYVPWGIMLFENDDPDGMEEIINILFSIGKERGSELLIGAALDGRSDICMGRNQFKKGLEYVEEALPYLQSSGHIPAQMNAITHQGVFLYMLNHFTEAQGSIKRALALGTGRKDRLSLYFWGSANYQMATIYVGMGYPKTALEYAKISLKSTRLSRSPYSAILPYCISGLAHYYLGNYEEGRDIAKKSIALSTQTNSHRMTGYASAHAGFNDVELGLFDSAWEHAQKAIEIGEKQGHVEIVSMGYKIFGDTYSRLEAFPQAVKAYQYSVDTDPGSFAMLENLTRLGLTLSLLGEPQGDALLKTALVESKAAGLDVIHHNAKALELSLFLLQDDYESFEKNAPLVVKELTERSHPKSPLWVDYLRARLQLKQENVEQANKAFKTLLDDLTAAPFFWIKFRALRHYIATCHKLELDSTAPRRELEEMLQHIEKGLGDAPLQEEWKNFAEKSRNL